MSEGYILHIIDRICDGEIKAFEELVEQYKQFVFALALKITQSREDAEEVTQDTFVKAYKSIRSFKGKSKFSTWLYRIAYFTAINNIRKKEVVTTSHETLAIKGFEAEDTNFSSIAMVTENERSHFLNKALSYLKPQERAVIVLFYLDEYSIEEISEITKLSVSNTKVKIHRTRKKLLQILNQLLKNEVHSLV